MRCERADCIYYSVESKNKVKPRCNYIFVTGVSKLSQIPEGEKYDISKCQFYEKKTRKAYNRITKPSVTPNGETTRKGVARIETIENAIDYYEANLSDTDMSILFGTTIQAVSAWRNKHGYTMKKCALSHIDWHDVKTMVDEGYSITAIAKYHNTQDFVIRRYIENKSRGVSGNAV